MPWILKQDSCDAVSRYPPKSYATRTQQLLCATEHVPLLHYASPATSKNVRFENFLHGTTFSTLTRILIYNACALASVAVCAVRELSRAD